MSVSQNTLLLLSRIPVRIRTLTERHHLAWFFPLLISLLLLPCTLLAQDYPVQTYTTANGLPSNWITTITQDSRGYIWGGGDGGVFRYDGVSFTLFGPTEGLPVPLAWSIIESRSNPGTILIGTHLAGVCKLADGKITSLSLGRDKRTNVVSHLLEDNQGTLWCGTTWGVVRVRNDSILPLPAPLDTGSIYFLHETRSGTILIGTGQGLYSYSHRDSLLSLNPFESPGIEFTTIVEEENGTMWLGTSGGSIVKVVANRIAATLKTNAGFLFSSAIDGSGVLWFCSQSGTVRIPTAGFPNVTTTAFREGTALGDRSLTAAFVDREDNLWLAGRGTGLARVAHRNIFRLALPDFQPDILNSSIAVHRSGHLFLAVPGSLREVWKDRNGMWTSHARRLDPIRSTTAIGGGTYSVVFARDDVMFVGFPEGGLRRYRVKAQADGPSTVTPDGSLSPTGQLPAGVLVGLAVTRNNYLWYNLRGGPLLQIDPLSLAIKGRYEIGGEILPGGTAQAILEENDGTLWIGSFAGGLTKYIPHNGEYQKTSTLIHENGLTSDRVRSLLQRRNGEIWIGTRFDGVSIMKGNLFSTLTTRDGLQSNAVWKMAEDEQGKIWLGTSMGLNWLDPATMQVHAYPVLTQKQVGGIGNIPGASTLWCAAGGELTLYEYGSEGVPSQPPLAAISGFRAGGIEHSLAYGEAISYNDNFCVFSFDGLSFKQPEGTRFRYRLVGLDTTWSELTTQRAVSYVSLSPGRYTFEVHAIAATGLRSVSPASLSFTILRPWYLSWWTIGLYVVFGSMSVFTYIRLRTRRLELRSAELERAVSERTAEIVEQRNQLHSQAGRLQALDALKSHFFTNISHEFRTPLTVILGHIDLMTRGKTSDTTLPIMKRNAQRLLQLISQLLDLSKLEAGAMTLRASRTDIVRFARRVVAAFGSYAGHKGITLTFNGRANPHADGQPAVFVYVDTDKMDKVLNNLLSNALKFTPHGGAVDVIITSGVLDDNTGGDTVEIMVKDTGPGIPREKIPFVFDRFYQVQDYAKPGVEGTGVGLALVKELVELHHGSVRVRSEVGSGSEFSIRIPTGIAHLDEGEIVEPEPEEFAPPVMPDDVSEVAAPSPTEYPPDATVLLLVEDNADLRSFMRDRLAEEYAILEADNGTTGFTMADTHLPDLIISDIMMPGIDGIALCAAIKSTAKTNHIPVILLTAKATIENKMEGLETGADDYLTKPFNADELALRVRNIIAMRRTLQEKFSNALLLQPSAIEVPSRQKEFLAQVMASIERHMSDEEFGVETLASDVAMSRAQLHRKLKALTNQSPNELIRSFRLHRAADLIVQDAGSLSEIAYQVGFSSQAYFTKCFVEKFHCTPSEYRKQAPSPPVT